MLKNNKVICNLPLNLLVEDAPEYNRDYKLTSNKNELNSKEVAINKSVKDILYKILGHVNFCSKKWIYEQYDSSVMGDTILTSNDSDASVVKIHGTEKNHFKGKGLAISTDCISRYVKNNPEQGTSLAVVEAARNLVSSGATPMAVTNNLNFGNPEKVKSWDKS